MSGQPAGRSKIGQRVAVNVSALGAASLFRIGLSFALQLLVAQSLGVAALGFYAATVAYIHLFQVICEWGLPSLLPRDLAQTPHHRLAGYRAALIIQTSLGGAIWLAIVVATPWLPTEMGRLLLIGGVTLPFYAVMSASETLCEACERMPLVMAIEVAANVLLFTASAFVLLAGGQLIHLMVVMAGVQVVMALASVVVARSAHLWPAPQSRPDWTISGLMRKSLPFLGLSLTDVLQQRADLLLVSFLAGPLTTGAYAAANSLVRVLIKLAQSYWRALYPTLSRLHQGQRDRFLLLQGMALRLGWAAALWAAAVAAGLATEIMLLFFGDDFVAASAVLRILIWSAPLYLLESYFIAILFVQRQPRTGLMVALTQLGVVVAALPPLILWVGIAGAAWGVVLAGIAGVCVGAWHVGTLNASSVTTLLLMLIAALAVAAAIWRLQETPWWAVSVGAALYGLLAWLVGGVGRRDLASLRQALVG